MSSYQHQRQLHFFPYSSLVNKNSERESNAISYPVYLYLSRSKLLVTFAHPNKKLPNVESVFKFFN